MEVKIYLNIFEVSHHFIRFYLDSIVLYVSTAMPLTVEVKMY